ncbi:AaceriAGL150Cp [[Ashbya] aceris (nom. inval.)]|nr:AaceriAGL150Cp [[Ashbya] aceris (nom. inval.)]
MSPKLTPLDSISNLLRFKNTNSFPTRAVWPVNRRAAVLILLFIGTHGELRVLLTKRSRGLNSFSGHVSLPGGKADNAAEPFDLMARREAEEEIGLPLNDGVLSEEYNLKIDPISGELPHYISSTFLSVKPSICFLYNADLSDEEKHVKALKISKPFTKLNPGETSSIFSIPLRDLVAHELSDQPIEVEYVRRREFIYDWGGLSWLVRHYYYAYDNIGEVSWLNGVEDLSSDEGDSAGEVTCRDVWGLTAKILYDVARIAEGLVTNSKSEGVYAHEALIYGLHELGKQMHSPKRTPWEVGMIERKRTLSCADVIPDYYMERLKSHLPL